MSDALLILNGSAPDIKILRKVARDVEIIACADGGLGTAVDAGLPPDVVIGDMDSRPKKLPKLPGTAYICDFDEHRSDFEKSLEWLKGADFKHVFVAGVRGGRVDHETINWSVIRAWSPKLPITVIDGGTTRLIGPGKHRFIGAKGKIVTLSPDGTSAAISTKGLKYPLKNEKLKPGSRGLSNQCTGKSFEIKVNSGKVWVIIPVLRRPQ